MLDRLRRHGRAVAWIPEWMGWGNQALAWFWAWRGLSRGEERFLLQTQAMSPWVGLFPQARRFTLLRSDVALLDRRIMLKDCPSDNGAPPHTKDYSTDELTQFVSEVLLSSARFRALLEAHPVASDALVLNIRRGDYYSPEHIGDFGMNLVGYVRAAVERAVASDGPPSCLTLVSDDIPWCLANLGFLSEIGPMTHADCASRTPATDLAMLAAARRLILTNSTFSYWGAHLSNVIHTDNHTSIWAPAFFDRSQNGGRTWLTDDRWQHVEDVPGGWDPPEISNRS